MPEKVKSKLEADMPKLVGDVRGGGSQFMGLPFVVLVQPRINSRNFRFG
jgi:hypothetical protein